VNITVLFFAQARERAGCASTAIELPEGSTVADALAAIGRVHPGLEPLWPHLAVAVDGRLAGAEVALPAGAELALLPPVSGGAGTAAGGSRARPRGKARGSAPARIELAPVTPERWSDLERLFGPRGACAGCWCMWMRLARGEFSSGKGEGNRRALRSIVRSGAEPGLLAYVDGEPAGWCAVAPRESYTRLARSRTLKPVDDRPAWSAACFYIAPPHRRRGLTVRLLREAVRFAAARGAKIIEGYPVDPSGKTADAHAWHGLASAFRRAGFSEVARRSPTRPIMRRFTGRGGARRAGASR